MSGFWTIGRIAGVVVATIALVFSLVLWLHGVSNGITDEDRRATQSFTSGIAVAGPESPFESQVGFITAIQDSVLDVAPVNKGIPYGRTREPKDLLEAQQGLCFDRSRVIEKILRSYGYETRHIFIYSTKETGSSIRSFVTPGVSSHAVSEVKTEKGWLVVDSNDRWISVDAKGIPRGMDELMSASDPDGGIEWKEEPPPIYRDIYPYTYVYGLYSRHGEFYPPYNPIPDVNYGELLYNFY